MVILDSTSRLLWEAISDIAKENGHSLIEPKSLSLLCLDFGITWEQREELIINFNISPNQDIFKSDPREILFTFKKIFNDLLIEHPDYNDLVVYSFLRAISKEYYPHLYPISSSLKAYFMINNTIMG